MLKITGGGVKIFPNVTLLKHVEFKKLEKKATLKIKNSKKKKVHLLPINQKNNSVNPKVKGSLQASFNIQARDTLNYEIVIIFYFLGLPFHLAKSSYYRSVFSYVVNTSNIIN